MTLWPQSARDHNESGRCDVWFAWYSVWCTDGSLIFWEKVRRCMEIDGVFGTPRWEYHRIPN